MTRRLLPFLAVLGLAFLLPGAAAASSTDEAIEEVVEVEVVEVVQAVDSAAGRASREIGAVQVYGRMHPALVHLPIGFLFLAVLLELAALTRRGREFVGCAGFALAATLIACLPALVSGFVRTSEMWPAGAPPDTATWHRNLMLGMAALAALALVLRVAFRGRLAGARRAAYLAVLAAAVVVAGVGGHLGGKLVFGESFLPF
jgi:uncharacterized membrane protein